MLLPTSLPTSKTQLSFHQPSKEMHRKGSAAITKPKKNELYQNDCKAGIFKYSAKFKYSHLIDNRCHF